MGEERPATLEEVEALFRYCTKPIPNKFRIAAEIELTEPPLSEKAVQEQLRAVEALLKDVERRNTTLRAARPKAKVSREAALGRRRLLQREWYSGKLYRLDQTDFSHPQAANFNGEIGPYLNTFVNVNDPDFAPFSSYRVDYAPTPKSATLDERSSVKWRQADLWIAYVIEPQLAFPFLLAVVETNSLPQVIGNVQTSSFAGALLDQRKARALIDGTHDFCRLTAHPGVIEGVPITTLQLDLGGQPSATNRISYSLDTATLSHLYEVEVLTKGQLKHKSSRRNFGKDGFPRWWYTEQWDETGGRHVKSVKFTEVAWDPQFDDREVFGGRFPTNYLVSLIDVAGKARWIQDPLGAKVTLDITPSVTGSARLKRTVILLVFIVLFASWPFFLMKSSRFRLPRT